MADSQHITETVGVEIPEHVVDEVADRLDTSAGERAVRDALLDYVEVRPELQAGGRSAVDEVLERVE